MAQQTCWTCGGTGYQYLAANREGSVGERETCSVCYGRGYTTSPEGDYPAGGGAMPATGRALQVLGLAAAALGGYLGYTFQEGPKELFAAGGGIVIGLALFLVLRTILVAVTSPIRGIVALAVQAPLSVAVSCAALFLIDASLARTVIAAIEATLVSLNVTDRPYLSGL